MFSLATLWIWWRNEMAALAPEPLKIALWGGSSARTLTFDGGLSKIRKQKGAIDVPVELLEPEPPVIPPLKRQIVVDVVLPDTFVLKRRIAAPYQARSKLHDLARLDLKRSTPFSDDDSVWSLGRSVSNGQEVVARQFVARTADLTTLKNRLSKLRLDVRRFLVADADGYRVVLKDLSAHSSPYAKYWKRLNAGLCIIGIGIATYLWLAPAWNAQSTASQLETRLQKLRDETIALRQNYEAAKAQQTAAEQLRTSMQFRPRLVEAIRNVTVAFPDESWISAFRFSPSSMTVTGETSGAAADLVLELSKNPQFENPRLSGPTTRTNSGREKFEIATIPAGSL